jgi:Na+/glutamate symporter
MSLYLTTIGLIFALMLGGIVVERLYRAFAARNPQLGPFRKTDGCGCCAAKTDCASQAACDKP